ncbi:MAG: NAD(P)/FAD-dependent oxidoreductase [Polyangiales bacterium]
MQGTSMYPHVVILGGGFAGLAAARALDGVAVEVTLVDRSNHHLFKPLLYQVASAALPAPDISVPIRKLLGKQRNVTVLMAEVAGIDPDRREVKLGHETLAYDYLVVATGTTHSYFGHDDWQQHAPGLKTIGEALEMRRRILRAFEAAELIGPGPQRDALTTFVVIGGGPTGVELAGAIAEMRRHTLAGEFRRIDSRTARVLLLEAGPRILPGFDAESAAAAHRQLEALGVEVRTGQPVSHVDGEGAVVGDQRIASRTVLWAAGVRASGLTRALGAPLDRSGRVRVDEHLALPGRREVFVAGDLIGREQDGAPLPGVAQLALQSGKHVGTCILNDLKSEARPAFRYKDRGMLATVGRHKAVAELGKLRFAGAFAWWLWLLVHLWALIEPKRRVSVLWEWTVSYLTGQRGSRVIVDSPPGARGDDPARAHAG